MPVLLVLGSKPNPALPSPDAYDDLACANASGRSAYQLGLRRSTFTVMSSVLTSGKNASNRLALEALTNLETGTLYYCPRQMYRNAPLKRLLHFREVRACGPRSFEQAIRATGVRFDAFTAKPLAYYIDMIRALCAGDREVDALLSVKHPSTGVVAVALGLAARGYRQVILSGFSFEISHAYAENPLIGTRGVLTSKHSDTDIAVLRRISEQHNSLLTTEAIVAERTGIPLLPTKEAATAPDLRAI